MEWLGWLTKGSCQVSLLDVCILILEIVALIFAGYGISRVVNLFKKKNYGDLYE
jgi:hypothetical protein